jgi:hypothetical protein
MLWRQLRLHSRSFKQRNLPREDALQYAACLNTHRQVANFVKTLTGIHIIKKQPTMDSGVPGDDDEATGAKRLFNLFFLPFFSDFNPSLESTPFPT